MIGEFARRCTSWHARRSARRECRAQLARLRVCGHSLAAPLAAAVADTLAEQRPAEDTQAAGRIEALRGKLARTSEIIDVTDYGAGEPTAPRGREQAQSGVPVTVEVRKLARSTSKSPPWSDLLYDLVRRLRPETCLEMGTCIGLSAAYLCAALARNGGGRLVTLEGDPLLAERARRHLEALGFEGFEGFEIVVGRFEQTLEPTLRRVGPVDFLFNDGHHDGEAAAAYFEQSLPYLRAGSVVLLDDIADYPSMRAAWRRLAEHPAVDLSLDFGQMGLLCIGPAAGGKRQAFTLPLP